MGMIIIGRAEIETTRLGEAAFDGKTDFIMEAIENGIDWKFEGSQVLSGAIYGGHLELAKKILLAGSPIEDNVYYIAFGYCPEILEHLPRNQDLVNKVKSSRRWTAFNWALVNEDVSLASGLLSEGVPINEKILISHGMGTLCPIHYAVRKGNLELIVMVVNAGADTNSLTENGKSALRLVAENRLLSNSQRKEAVRFLQSRGADFFPPASIWQKKFAAWFGWPIPERS